MKALDASLKSQKENGYTHRATDDPLNELQKTGSRLNAFERLIKQKNTTEQNTAEELAIEKAASHNSVLLH